MELNDFFAKLDAVFIHDFPSVNHEYLENGFLTTLRKAVQEQGFKDIIVKSDGEIDLDWVSFLWWVFEKDGARINDALHGCLWTPEGDVRTLDPSSSLTRFITTDPIARAERIKIKDYIKHINWVYHKTQNLPNLIIIGSDNIPERLHSLRNANVTLLDPKISLPEKKLFPDLFQRRRFHAIESYDIFDVMNPTEGRLIGSQNVVIIDDREIAFNSFELEQKILLAGSLLTEHGRCLFDLPMYGKALSESYLFDIVQKFTNENTKYIASNATAIDSYVHEVIANINKGMPEDSINENYQFEIEDLKLTDVGLQSSVAMRVYLKKVYV